MRERLFMPEDKVEISPIIESRGAAGGDNPDPEIWTGADSQVSEASKSQAQKLFELEARVIYLPVSPEDSVTCVDDRCPETFDTGFKSGSLESGEIDFPQRGPRSPGGTPVVAMLRAMALGNTNTFEQDLHQIAEQDEDLGAHFECYALGHIPVVFKKILKQNSEPAIRRFAEANFEGKRFHDDVWQTAYDNYRMLYSRLGEYLGPNYEELALDFIARKSRSPLQPEKLADIEHNVSAIDINKQNRTTLSREAIAILTASGAGVLGSDAWYPREKAKIFSPDNPFLQKVFIAQHDIYTTAIFTELSSGSTSLFIHHNL
jgi:hypothetical protein